ncbi:hypothetical protein L0222_20255, partial [bacterium]|nr:hypothetical protein [bacterium]
MIGSRSAESKQHCHISINFDYDEDEIQAVIKYHQVDLEIEDLIPPHLEELDRWFSQFFKTDSVKASIEASFEFGEDSRTFVPLPFPLLTDSEELSGSIVDGISIQFSQFIDLRKAIIQREEDGYFITVYKDKNVNPKVLRA